MDCHPQNNVHVHPQLKNTLSQFNWNIYLYTCPIDFIDLKAKSIDSKLMSIEILTYHLDLQGKSIAIEILTYPLDLKGTSIENKLISIENPYLILIPLAGRLVVFHAWHALDFNWGGSYLLRGLLIRTWHYIPLYSHCYLPIEYSARNEYSIFVIFPWYSNCTLLGDMAVSQNPGT